MRKWFKPAIYAALLSTSISAALPASAAVDMFIKLDGIKGETTDKAHPSEIEVLSWSWGVANASPSASAEKAAGRTTVQALSLTKTVDKSSPVLIEYALTGKRIKNAVFVVRKAGETPLEFVRVTLEDVGVSSVSVSGSSASDRPLENVTLSFKRVKFEYTGQNAKGAKGDQAAMSWDIAEAKPF